MGKFNKTYRSLDEYYEIETLIGILLLDIEEDTPIEFIKKSNIYTSLYDKIINNREI
jgi:hypothetical protein